MIRLFKPYMHPSIPLEVGKVVASGYVGDGPKVRELEKELGKLIGNDNVVATNSGTMALMIALRCAGVGSGSIVVSTPMTCLATNEAILAL